MWALGMLIGQVMGWLVLSDWYTLFGDTVLLEDGLVLGIWLVWCMVANAALNTHTLPASIGLTTGGICSTMTIPQVQKDTNTKSPFIVMSSSLLHPGTMIGGLYFFIDTYTWLWLWLLAIFYFVLGTDKKFEAPVVLHEVLFPSKWHGIAGFILGAAFLFSQWSIGVLLCTLPVWMWKSRTSFPWRSLVYVAGVFACVNLAVASGLPEMAAWGLEELPMDVHFVLPTAILVASALLSALIGAIPMAFFGVALFERLMDLPSIGLSTGPLLALYGVGLVAGNVRPMIWAKAVRQNVFYWFISSFVFINLLAVVVYKTF